MNIIKKFKLNALKALGFKKSGPMLGAAYGVVNASLKTGDDEMASDDASTIAFTLDEVMAALDHYAAVFEGDDALALLKADLIKERAIFFEISAFINNRGA